MKIIDRIKLVPYIIQGWRNVILDLVSDIKYKKEFDERLRICRECPHCSHGICDICGCVLIAKTKSEDSECPDGRWFSVNKKKE